MKSVATSLRPAAAGQVGVQVPVVGRPSISPLRAREKEQSGPELWAVAGGKGGVGKSVLSANLALWAARRGLSVMLVDADLGGANQHTLFGVQVPRLTVQQFLNGEHKKLEDVALPTRYQGLKLVSGRCDELGDANPQHSRKMKLVRHLKKAPVDVVLIDLGAGTSFNVMDLFLAADVQLVVTVPEPTAIQNAYGFMKCAYARAKDRKVDPERFVPRVVINQATEGQAQRTFDALRAVTERFLGRSPSYAGHVRRDKVISTAVSEQTPVMALAPSSGPAQDMATLAGSLLSGSFERDTAARVRSDAESKPATGLNEDVRVGLRLFHVQTEDLGEEKAQVRTQVFQGGRVIFTKVTPHGVSFRPGVTMTLKEHMSFQHRAIIKALHAGRVG